MSGFPWAQYGASDPEPAPEGAPQDYATARWLEESWKVHQDASRKLLADAADAIGRVAEQALKTVTEGQGQARAQDLQAFREAASHYLEAVRETLGRLERPIYTAPAVTVPPPSMVPVAEALEREGQAMRALAREVVAAIPAAPPPLDLAPVVAAIQQGFQGLQAAIAILATRPVVAQVELPARPKAVTVTGPGGSKTFSMS